MSLLHRKQLLDDIWEKLAIVTKRLHLDSSLMSTDINAVAEEFYCGILNIILDLSLTNLNHLRMDYPAIDLADIEARVCVQITSTSSRKKIDHTLERFFAYDQDHQFDRLIVLILGDRMQYRNVFHISRTFDFDPDRDIWDTSKLMSQIEALNDDRLAQVHHYLQQELGFIKSPPVLQLPVRTALSPSDFVGREKELAQISRSIMSGDNPVIISGVAGIGKTELVCRFAQNYGAGNVYFIRFQESFRKTVAVGVAAGMSNLPNFAAEEEIYQMALYQLRECGVNDILIIDGVDDSHHTLQELMRDIAFVDLRSMRLRLILTTRSDYPRAIKVMPMDMESLFNIFENHGAELTRLEMVDLIDAVNGHTLTVDLMARTLVRSWGRVTPENILTALREHKLRDQKYRRIVTAYSQSPEQARIYEHLNVVFNVSGMSGEVQQVMRCASLLPESGMDAELFGTSLEEEALETLNILLDQGWLEVKNDLLTIHPVVRLVCWTELKPNEESCGTFLDALWGQLGHDKYDRVKFAQLAEVFANAIKIDGAAETKAKWLNCSGWLWNELMEFRKAAALYETYIPVLEPFLHTHPALAAAYNNVGSTYGDLGDHKKALEYQLKALAIKEKVLPQDHPDLASSYNNVGMTYGDLGDRHKALEHMLKGLEIYEKVLTQDHPDLASSYNNAGMTYSDLGDHQKALEYMLKGLEIRVKVLPAEHPDLASSYNNVGSIYGDLGDHNRAMEYQLKALEIFEKVLPPEHPSLAVSYNNVGITFAYLELRSKAVEYLEKAMEIFERSLPAEHPYIESTKKSIANLIAAHTTLDDRNNALEYTQFSRSIPDAPSLALEKWILGTPSINIEEVYIWASDKSWPDQQDAITAQYDLEEPGCYVNREGSQLLLLGASQEQIDSALHTCTNLQKLSVQHVEEATLPLSRLPLLGELHLEYANAEIILDQMHQQLRTVKVSQSQLGNTSFLTMLPELWDLSLTSLQGDSEIPDLTVSSKLINLDLSDSPIVSLDALPNSIEYLCLARTGLTQIPESAKPLGNLKQLDLRGLHLRKLPLWLADLNLSACLDKPFPDHAILLTDTNVDGVDLSSIPPQKELLREWLQAAYESKDESLNEIKVIFLGDGEAGKTHLIARLKKDGEKIAPNEDNQTKASQSDCGISGNVTPGISITDHEIKLENRTVKVHYWDFGGQEFLHAMHRIFMTKKTLYVVVLNARNDTQDHRAEFWLQNINTVDQDAQAILVLNKIDQNPRASINENRLRRMYPSLKDVVKISALNASRDEMEEKLIRVIRERIEGFKALNTPFPDPWHAIRKKLEASSEPYIDKDTFEEYCEEEGITDVGKQAALETRFSELGVSFSCEDTRLLLKPAWITNAIYRILFNRHERVGNGVIEIEEIKKCLTSQDSIWSVDTSIKYKKSDARTILDVMHNYKLSFTVKPQISEFIPMLCERNESPLVKEYADDPFALEIRWVFDHLPDGLLYRLMVDRHSELDRENVWLSGARFINWYTKSSAIVERCGNTLTIHVRSEHPAASVQKYVDELEGAIRKIINGEYSSFIEKKTSSNSDPCRYTGFRRELVHKLKNSKETFCLDRLEADRNCQYYSTLLETCIRSDELLKQCYQGIEAEQGLLIRDIVSACRHIQGAYYIREDDRNTTVRNSLRDKGYEVSDQSLCGEGKNRNAAGELDLQIRKDPATPWTIFEALNHGGPAYWKKHLDKLLKNYNAHGLKILFLVAYIDDNDFKNIAELKSEENFDNVTKRYWTTLRSYSPEGCKCITNSCQDVSEIYNPDALGIKVFQCLYEDSVGKHTVYHLFVHIRRNRSPNKQSNNVTTHAS